MSCFTPTNPDYGPSDKEWHPGGKRRVFVLSGRFNISCVMGRGSGWCHRSAHCHKFWTVQIISPVRFSENKRRPKQYFDLLTKLSEVVTPTHPPPPPQHHICHESWTFTTAMSKQYFLYYPSSNECADSVTDFTIAKDGQCIWASVQGLDGWVLHSVDAVYVSHHLCSNATLYLKGKVLSPPSSCEISLCFVCFPVYL